MTPTLIFWLGIIVVFLFLLFILRKYIGRIIIFLISLVMICGIFFFLNPTATKNFFNFIQNIPQNIGINLSQTEENTETNENAETYSRFASLFHKETPQTLGTLITTGDENNLSENNQIQEEVNTGAISITKKIQAAIATGNDLNLNETAERVIEENPEYTKDDEGRFIFDANIYEVGVIEGKLVISEKSLITDTKEEENNETGIEKEIESVPTKTTTKNVITSTQNSLSAQDIKEANEIFGE